MGTAESRACCIDGDVTKCPAGLLPGELSCDATVRAYCTHPEAGKDPRCSCWSKPDELQSAERRAQWFCFSRDCWGPEKLVLREWRDARCPDYVSCRTKVSLGGNLRVLPGAIKHEQNCGGGGGHDEVVVDDRRDAATIQRDLRRASVEASISRYGVAVALVIVVFAVGLVAWVGSRP